MRWTYLDPESEEPILIYPQPCDIPLSTRPRISVTHDEYSFNTKDGIKQGWFKGDSIPFFDKGRGALIVVSEFMTPGGNLQLPSDTPLHEQRCEPDGDPFRECTQIFEPMQEGEY